MISLKQFTQLNYQEKKNILTAIFTQLDDQKAVSFEDVIFLLGASNAIKETTLDGVYTKLYETLDQSKTLSYTQQELKNIKSMLLHDAEGKKEKAEAESLLDTI